MLDYISFALELSKGIIKKFFSMSGVFRYHMSVTTGYQNTGLNFWLNLSRELLFKCSK